MGAANIIPGLCQEAGKVTRGSLVQEGAATAWCCNSLWMLHIEANKDPVPGHIPTHKQTHQASTGMWCCIPSSVTSQEHVPHNRALPSRPHRSSQTERLLARRVVVRSELVHVLRLVAQLLQRSNKLTLVLGARLVTWAGVGRSRVVGLTSTFGTQECVRGWVWTRTKECV